MPALGEMEAVNPRFSMQVTFPASGVGEGEITSGISYHIELRRFNVALITTGHLVGGIVVAIAAGSAIDALVTRYWFSGGRILAGVLANWRAACRSARDNARRLSDNCHGGGGCCGLGDGQKARTIQLR